MSNITTQTFLPACINPFHSTLTNQQVAKEDIFVKIVFVEAPYVWNNPFVGLSWDVLRPPHKCKATKLPLLQLCPENSQGERPCVYIMTNTQILHT